MPILEQLDLPWSEQDNELIDSVVCAFTGKLVHRGYRPAVKIGETRVYKVNPLSGYHRLVARGKRKQVVEQEDI